MKMKMTVVALALALAVTGSGPSLAAGIPVVDVANLTQNVANTIEAVAQTAKQIQEYQTQLQQYANMLQNTTAPASQIWDNATRTMANLRSAIDTLAYYKARLGSLTAYMDKFGNFDDYAGSPCFDGSGGCTATERARLEAIRSLGYESQERANRASLEAIDLQQVAIEDDARQLQRLQSAATGANGQLQAIGYANQLASQQANQLLQIRGLLIAQQNLLATRRQAQLDEEARGRARRKQVTTWTYTASPADNY